MCGIAGILSVHTPASGKHATPPHPLELIPEAWLDVLDASIQHRGPDGQGRFRDRAIRPDGTIVDIALIHRRLSILDHAGGHQPMVHDGKRLRPDLTYQPGDTPLLAHEVAPNAPLVTVVFNGCLYTHRELRGHLEEDGHRFESDHSDTEVFIHGWRAWGKALQEWIFESNMYSALIWDRSLADCISFRDAFGQKPLVIAGEDVRRGMADPPVAPSHPVIFCSSAAGPAILLGGDGIDPRALAGWVTFGHDPLVHPQPHTLMVAPSSVGRLLPWSPPAETPADSTARAKADRAYAGQLIQPARRGLRLHVTQRHAASAYHDAIDSLLSLCVEQRLEADVPVACLLSGGIDSSLIAAYAHRATGNLRTICVRMPDARYDESHAAQVVADHLGTEHHTIDCEADAASDLVRLIHQLGVPFGDSSLLPTYWACKAARTHAGVLLTGDGGDEMFIGYNRYLVAHGWKENIPLLLNPIAQLLTDRVWPRRDATSRWTQASRIMQCSRGMSYLSLLAIFPQADAVRLMGSSAPRLPLIDLESDPIKARDMDLQFTLPGDYLRKVDAASMAVPVETRAPFLDRRLLLATERLGARLVAGGRKRFLRDLAGRYLPDSIVRRPKQGFAIPVGEWFRNDFGGMRQFLHDQLTSAEPFPGLAEAGMVLNRGCIRQMLREHDAAGEKSFNPWHGRDHSQRLYMLLVLSIWAHWLDGVQRSGVCPVAS